MLPERPCRTWACSSVRLVADDERGGPAPLTAAEWGFGPLFAAIKDAVIVAGGDGGRILLWNRGAEAMFQYSDAQARALLLEDLVPEELKAAHRAGMAAYAQRGHGKLIDGHAPVEVPAVRRDGSRIIVELSLSRITNPRDPGGCYAMGLLRDVTALRESEQTLRLVLDSSPQPTVALDREGTCTMANRAAAALLGSSQDELVGRNMHEVMHHSRADGTPFPADDCRIYATVREGLPARVEDEVFWRSDGTSFFASYQSDPIRQGGTHLGAVVTFVDITDRRRQEEAAARREERLRLRAQTDVLTGVGNRRYLNTVLTTLTSGDAVVMLDIDNFKAINDERGHNAGDELLVSLAAHLRGQLRDHDGLARFGGEEFVLLVRAPSDAVEAVRRIARTWAARGTGVSFSAGVARHSRGDDPSGTLAAADDALYEAKRRGRNRVVAQLRPEEPPLVLELRAQHPEPS